MARLVALILFGALLRTPEACSRVLFNQGDSDLPVLVARTMDWAFTFDDHLLVNPRGQEMDGGLGGEAGSKRWRSKYASVVTSANGWLSPRYSSHTGKPFDFAKDGATDGINERGLAAHVLLLEATKYSATPSTPTGLTYLRWVRYLLDNCANVQQAVDAMKDVQIIDVKVSREVGAEGFSFPVHLAVEDASGDSAIFELIDGAVVTYHGRSPDYSVMTNDPPLPAQLANLAGYTTFGGEKPLPGDTTSPDRFVRMRYFIRYMPHVEDANTMAGYIKTVISQAAVPQGAPYHTGLSPREGVYPTWWTSIADTTSKVYYWSWSLNPNTVWVNVSSLAANGKFQEGAPTLVLNPRRASLVGDVSSEFRARLRL